MEGSLPPCGVIRRASGQAAQARAAPCPGACGSGFAVAILFRPERGLVRASKVSDANEISGSQVGSQQGQMSGDARPRPPIANAGEQPSGRCQATLGDCGDVLWEQEAASSNLAIPTSSEHMWILLKIVCGGRDGSQVWQFGAWQTAKTRPQRGLDLTRPRLGVLG